MATSDLIVLENQKAGTPQDVWDVNIGPNDPGYKTIEGFATDISVNHGTTVSFKINANALNDATADGYHIDIYRPGRALLRLPR